MFNPRFHKVNTVDEAVELANDLKEKGGYDLFRGQIKNWPLKSSFGRQVDKNKKGEALEKMARFESWVKRTKGLEELAKHSDDIIAVAQHYGIPTNFVDFTTSPRVAGFFASYGKIEEENVESCILCLNSQDLMDFWKNWFMQSEYPLPEILYLEVQNLWRLEAQHGVFLFCPYSNFEHIYDLDRIYFPYNGQISSVTEDEIFPKRKSQLEILLDQYFMNELMMENEKNIPVGMMRHTIPEIKEKCNPELVLNGTPPPKLSSWDDSNIEPWLVQPNEKYLNTLDDETWEMALDLNKDLGSIQNEALDYLTKQLKNSPNVRNRLLNWSVTIVGTQQRNPIENRVESYIKRLWDGLRKLPYDDQDIAKGLANCFMLASYLLKQGRVMQVDWTIATSECFGETIEIEFGSEDGSYSRSFASKSKLLAAIRDDIYDYLDPKWKPQLEKNITGLLQAIWTPSRLFDYDKLAKLFAHEIAPVQVIMRSERVAIFFSPARLDSFGLA
jgi:hypothetical protein